jgi:hypothetical protein
VSDGNAAEQSKFPPLAGLHVAPVSTRRVPSTYAAYSKVASCAASLAGCDHPSRSRPVMVSPPPGPGVPGLGGFGEPPHAPAANANARPMTALRVEEVAMCGIRAALDGDLDGRERH